MERTSPKNDSFSELRWHELQVRALVSIGFFRFTHLTSRCINLRVWIPPLKRGSCQLHKYCQHIWGTISKNAVIRANRQIWAAFTEAIVFKDPLSVFCKASFVHLHFILIKESFCYRSEHLKAFSHTSLAVVKNANTEEDTDHKNSQSA